MLDFVSPHLPTDEDQGCGKTQGQMRGMRLNIEVPCLEVPGPMTGPVLLRQYGGYCALRSGKGRCLVTMICFTCPESLNIGRVH